MSRPDRLSAELVRLREESGMSGRTAAAKVGLSQSRLSRIERGAFMPTADEIRTLCKLYRATAQVRRELVAIADDIREDSSSARVVMQRGAWRMQERIARIEEASARIRSFHPVIVAGLLQSADYMKAAARLPDRDDETLSARAERQRVLDTDREFAFLLSEGALRWNIGGPSVMVSQLGHLAAVAGKPNVRLGIIPYTAPVPLPPLHGFHLYDSRAVIVGTHTATAIITDGRDVADYERAFTVLEHAAVFGQAARDVLDRIAADYRELS